MTDSSNERRLRHPGMASGGGSGQGGGGRERIDPTVDVHLRSWVESANDAGTDFPVQNLPFCTFVPNEGERPKTLGLAGDEERGGGPGARGVRGGEGNGADRGRSDDGDTHDEGEDDIGKLGVAIGDSVLDLDMLMHAGAFDDSTLEGEEVDDDFLEELHECLHYGGLQELVALPAEFARFLREQAQSFLLDGGPSGGQTARRLRAKAVRKMSEVSFKAPLRPLNYTDFYASIHHARTVGSMFRPENPLLPNYKHVPIGYHGRASSIVGSGTEIKRPRGQTNIENAATPTFGPSKRLDYEMEVGAIIAGGNLMGEAIEIEDALEYFFGAVLVNDWSTRDVQAWEYQPLGPFLAKNFATTISPFVVTRDALRPFFVAGAARPEGDPAPMDYLRGGPEAGLDVTLEVRLRSARMRAEGMEAFRVSRGSFREMYWTLAQMITHHTVNGCNLEAGDLLASGTVSGAGAGERGCMLELTWVGNGADGKPLPRKAIELPTGEKRVFLEDGDEVVMTGWCERAGYRRVGFGECRGVVVG
ncbi:fumarylacetoacetase [soil metagenome]